MQFFCVIGLAAALSLRVESELRQPGPGDKPPKCIRRCENPCADECDKSKCSEDIQAKIKEVCHGNEIDVRANIAKRIHDNVAQMETCDEKVDCSQTVVENCEKLWKAKMEVCIDKAEEWAYSCSAPTYNGHNCAYGCCSKVSQEVQEGCGDQMPSPQDMWEGISDGEKITKEGFEKGLTFMLPEVFGEYVPKLVDCMMKGYDVNDDGQVDKDEFKKGYGKHLPVCLEEHVPKELLAEMANHQNCGDEADTLETVFKQLSGGDDEIIPADLAAVMGMQAPQFAEHALPLAECIVGLVDGNDDGAVQYDEFKAAAEKELDIMTPCMEKHIPKEDLAKVAAHNDEHWCDYTDPEKEPCCTKSSHEEQDACMEEKMAESHYCDFTGPEEEPCCAKQSREDQDACLGEKKGHYCDFTGPEEEPCCAKQSREDQDACLGEKKGHYCDSTGPEEEPCCAKQSREDQDACLKEKKGHYCDSTGPEEEPCCAKESREDQDACLEAKGKGLLFGQKKRAPHLVSKALQAAFARFLRGELSTKSSKAIKL